MKIKNLRRERVGSNAVLSAEVTDIHNLALAKWEGRHWVSLPYEYEHWLSDDRYDGFLLGLLYPAMAYGEDIEVDGDVSGRLLHNIREHVIHILLAYSPSLRTVSIKCRGKAKVIESAGHVGTGFSGGVDSFCTIYDRYQCEVDQDFKIDTLLNINAGNYYGKSSEETRRLFQNAYQRLRGFPDYVGLPYVPVDSSLAYIYNEKWKFQKVHLLNTIACVLCFQSYFGKYYLASAVSYKELEKSIPRYRDFDIAGFCDVYILQHLSTESLLLVPDGHRYTRAEKTERISEYAPTYKYLEVTPPGPDGKQPIMRPKCIRVLTCLDALGRLDLYSEIFDLKKYRKLRFVIRCQVVANGRKDLYAADNIEFSRVRGKRFPGCILSNLVWWSCLIYQKATRRMRRVFAGKS